MIGHLPGSPMTTLGRWRRSSAVTSHQDGAGGLSAMVRPAGFWRRVLAFALDALVVVGPVALLGLLLFEPTGGAVRVKRFPLVDSSICAAADVDRHAAAIPSGFRVADATLCASATFGTVHDLWLVVRGHGRAGGVAETLRVPLGSDGNPAQPYYLDHVDAPALVVYLMLCELLFGASLGKRIMGIWVRPVGGGRLSFASVCRRMLRFVPLVLLVPSGGPIADWVPRVVDAGVLVGVVVFVVFVANFVVALLEDDLPWHDRLAGTDVVTAR